MPNHQCPTCGKTFPQKWRLNRHLDSGRSCVAQPTFENQQEGFKCRHCDQVLTHKKSLSRHLRRCPKAIVAAAQEVLAQEAKRKQEIEELKKLVQEKLESTSVTESETQPSQTPFWETE